MKRGKNPECDGGASDGPKKEAAHHSMWIELYICRRQSNSIYCDTPVTFSTRSLSSQRAAASSPLKEAPVRRWLLATLVSCQHVCTMLNYQHHHIHLQTLSPK
jgi:hypothetical protein